MYFKVFWGIGGYHTLIWILLDLSAELLMYNIRFNDKVEIKYKKIILIVTDKIDVETYTI